MSMNVEVVLLGDSPDGLISMDSQWLRETEAGCRGWLVVADSCLIAGGVVEGAVDDMVHV